MRPSPATVLGPVLALSALITVLVTAFAWPTSNLAPRHLPVGLAGPAPAVEQVRQGLAALGTSAIDTTTYPDRSAAVRAIEDRDIYGAIVIGANGPEVLTASAAGPAVAQALSEAARSMSQQRQTPAPQTNSGPSQQTDSPAAGQPSPTPQQLAPTPVVTDVVATPPADPHGAVFGLTLVPIVIGGLLTGAALSLLPLRRTARVGAAVAVALIAGFAVTAVLHTWLGVLTGNYLANAGVIALAIGAIALTLLGLRAAIGLAGLGLGAATFVALGIPLSGAMSAPELLPTGWGTLGTLLPPGAAATALRSTAYFGGSGSATALAVLSCWTVGGLLLAALPQRTRHLPEQALDAAPTQLTPTA
ncbi:ABC transporter permease [Nocardia africana]|uniref:ABC transporter permease n=1 Tax=Nocardia africana TaxID=134964 RepID=A0ABW6NHP1_9NOCA